MAKASCSQSTVTNRRVGVRECGAVQVSRVVMCGLDYRDCSCNRRLRLRFCFGTAKLHQQRASRYLQRRYLELEVSEISSRPEASPLLSNDRDAKRSQSSERYALEFGPLVQIVRQLAETDLTRTSSRPSVHRQAPARSGLHSSSMARKSLFCEVIGKVRARASEPRGTITDELRDVVGPRSAHHESTRVRERDEDLERA